MQRRTHLASASAPLSNGRSAQATLHLNDSREREDTGLLWVIKIYRNIILPIVLYGCETWSLTLWEERKLRVFENMVLRRIFGPKSDKEQGSGGNYIGGT